jgi:hypothetical protein
MSEFLIVILSFFKEALSREYLDLSVGNLTYLFFLNVASGCGVMYMDISTFEKETTMLP